MRRLLLGKRSDSFRSAIISALDASWDISIAEDGETVCRLLDELNPDVLILDLNLSGKKAMDILAERFPFLPPTIIGLTSSNAHHMSLQASRWGVDQVLQVPFDTSLLSHCLGSDFRNIESKRIVQHLRVLSFDVGLNGYYYLMPAISRLRKDPSLHLHKEVYPAIAQANNTDPRAVERAIRNAIGSAWKRRNPGVWEYYFPCDQCPKNKTFITTLALMI